mgnify:FL=1
MPASELFLFHCSRPTNVLNSRDILMRVFFHAGVIELVSDYTVCKEGEHISPEASRILVNFLYFKHIIPTVSNQFSL